MKRLLIPAWVPLALEVAFVVMLAITQNAGDDAAGRGVATGFAIVLAPIVLLTAGLLFWGSRGGPAPALWAGLLLAFAPVIYFAVNMTGDTVSSISQAMGRAEFGKFDERRLTTLARAIEKVDVANVRSILADGPVDWSARDRRGQTILGHAIQLAADEYEDRRRVEPVRLLLAAGAPVRRDVIAAARTAASVSNNNVVYHLIAIHTKNALAVLDLLLSRGLDPNEVDEDGNPIYLTTYATLAGLEVLARHGADFSRLDTRTDRPGWNGLMLAASMTEWAEATFYLRHGLSPTYTARDGASLRTVLAEVDPPETTYYGDDIAAHATFLAELSRYPGWK